MTTYCVCGQESGNDPWEPIEAGLADYETAARWLRENHRTHAEYSAFYIDREDNEGHAEAYFDRNADGSLSEYQGAGKVYFAD